MPPSGFEWDSEKARTNIVKHSFSFDDAVLIWGDNQSVEIDDDREDYGERRTNRLGMLFGRLFSVCYTMRGPNIRIFSARKANRREHDIYFKTPR